MEITDADGTIIAGLEWYDEFRKDLPHEENGHLMAAAPMLETALRTLMRAKTGEEIKEARRYADIVLLNARGFADDDE
jgi:hypothetical protein